MLSLSSSVCIDAPPERVWARLAALEDIQLWSEAVIEAACEEGLDRGVGAQRTCRLSGGVTLRERWVAWDEGRSFTYEGAGIPLVSRAWNRWTVKPAGDMSLLTSEAEVVLKGGILGGLLEPAFGYQFKRMAPRSLAAFKHLVEHGEPPQVRHSKLAPAPVSC